MKKNNWPTGAQPDESPAEIGATVAFHKMIMELPPVDLKSAKEIKERLEWYLDYCIRNQRRPFVEGMCSALKITRMGFWKIAQEQSERGEVARSAKAVILSLLETWTIEGRLNPASSCFLYKNLGQYADTVTIEANRVEVTERANMTPEQIRELVERDIPLDEPEPEPEPLRISENVI